MQNTVALGHKYVLFDITEGGRGKERQMPCLIGQRTPCVQMLCETSQSR